MIKDFRDEIQTFTAMWHPGHFDSEQTLSRSPCHFGDFKKQTHTHGVQSSRNVTVVAVYLSEGL